MLRDPLPTNRTPGAFRDTPGAVARLVLHAGGATDPRAFDPMPRAAPNQAKCDGPSGTRRSAGSRSSPPGSRDSQGREAAVQRAARPTAAQRGEAERRRAPTRQGREAAARRSVAVFELEDHRQELPERDLAAALETLVSKFRHQHEGHRPPL